MAPATLARHACPVTGMSDERKTAGIATGGAVAGAVRVDGYAAARAVLRDERARQAGFRASLVERFGKAHAPILFLQGEAHRRQRAATARLRALNSDHRMSRSTPSRSVEKSRKR